MERLLRVAERNEITQLETANYGGLCSDMRSVVSVRLADPGWFGQSPREPCQLRSVAARDEGDSPLRVCRSALCPADQCKGVGSPRVIGNPGREGLDEV